MNVMFSETFVTLFLGGLWLPLNLKSKPIIWIFRIYTSVMFCSLGLFMFALFITVFINDNQPEDVAQAWYFILMSITGCVKGYNFMKKSKGIDDLIGKLMLKKCLPNNKSEEVFYSGFNTISRNIGFLTMFLGYSSTIIQCVVPLLVYNTDRKYPVLIFSTHYANENQSYWLYYFIQVLALNTINSWNMANDILVSRFIVQICVQLELVSHRIQVLPAYVKLMASNRLVTKSHLRKYEQKIMKQNIQHHVFIFELVRDIETNFGLCIGTQYCLSTLVLCSSIFELESSHTNRMHLIIVTFYLIAMLTEWFLYCWFGNEVISKSQQFNEIVCRGDWTILHVGTLKELLIMMIIMTTSPISIKYGPLITLSTESYIRILRSSYSAFKYLKLFI